MKNKIKQFLIRWFHPKLRGKMPIIISDTLLKSFINNNKHSPMKEIDIINELCTVYDIEVPKIKTYLNKDEYLDFRPNGEIFSNGTAGCYNYVTKTIHFLSNDRIYDLRLILHEFYHHLDNIRNGKLKWSVYEEIDCNGVAEIFAVKYDFKLMRLVYLQSSNTS
jgi:hypothetical protein